MEIFDEIMKFMQYFIVTGSCATVIYAVYKWLRRPSDNNLLQLKENRKDIDCLKLMVQKNNTDINDVKELQAVMSKALVSIMDNDLYGNNTDDMKKCKVELIEQISKK